MLSSPLLSVYIHFCPQLFLGLLSLWALPHACTVHFLLLICILSVNSQVFLHSLHFPTTGGTYIGRVFQPNNENLTTATAEYGHCGLYCWYLCYRILHTTTILKTRCSCSNCLPLHTSLSSAWPLFLHVISCWFNGSRSVWWSPHCVDGPRGVYTPAVRERVEQAFSVSSVVGRLSLKKFWYFLKKEFCFVLFVCFCFHLRE